MPHVRTMTKPLSTKAYSQSAYFLLQTKELTHNHPYISD